MLRYLSIIFKVKLLRSIILSQLKNSFVQKPEHMGCSLEAIRFQIKTVNIRPEDIVEGNSKLTLGLIWTVILNFQVSVIKQRQQEASGSQVNHL